MANSFVQYPGDGSTRVFAVPFKYLDRSHIKVQVDGGNRAFDWLSSNSIRLTFAPASDKTVVIRRVTPNDKPLVDFQDGSTITEKDLDKLAYQNVFLSQEAIDLYTTVNGTAEGLVGLVQQALNSSATSEAQAAEALLKATNAENTVLNTGSQVNTDRDAVETARDVTLASTAQAQSAASTAVSNSAISTTKAAEALASAQSAAHSASIAEAAAGFNPSDFYTKVQMDGLLNETTFQLTQIEGLTEAIAGKADATHTHPVSQVSGLQSILDAKLGSTATAAAAAKWSASRTITVTGGATGSFSMDGSANATLALTITANSHAHTIANVTGLQDALDGKAPTSHTHTTSQITGLDSALAGRAPTSHTHTTAQVTGLDAALAAKANAANAALTGTPTAPTAADGTNSTQIATTQFVNTAIGAANTPAGTIVSFGGPNVPSGWLKCNGAAVSRTVYSALFAAIGTLYGAGDGSTTFNLPDTRGEFVRGFSDGLNVDTGRALGSKQDHMFQNHRHSQNYSEGNNTSTGSSFSGTRITQLSGGQSTNTGTASTGDSGSETRPRNIAFHFLIKF